MITAQLPNESSKAYRAYLCYEKLGRTRSIALAYAKYRNQSESSAKPSSAFIGWKSEFNWEERVMAYDLEEEARERDRQRAIDDDAYQVELEEFRQNQLNAGKTGTAIALELKQRLLDWVEAHPKIESWSDALVVARIITTLETTSFEQWAKAIHIDILLAQMDDSEIDD